MGRRRLEIKIALNKFGRCAIRIRAEDIRVMSRYSRGVRLMRVNGDDKVVSFTRAEHDEDAEITAVDQTSEEDDI